MRSKNLLIGLLIAFVLGAGAFWANQVNKGAAVSQNALEASYQNSFFNLIENFENLDVLLGKILASKSDDDQNIISLVTVWSMAEVAKTNLGNLPIGTASMMRSNNYLSQLGDFSYSLAKRIAGNLEITNSEWEQIRQLHQENRQIHTELRELLGTMQAKQITFGSLKELSDKADLNPDSKGILDGFGKLDERLQDEVPTLTYDGPFSDHVVNREPRGLSGPALNEEEALSAALQFVEKISPNIQYSATNSGFSAGRIPAYSIKLQPADASQPVLTGGISQNGGHVVFMMDTTETAQVRRINEEHASLEASNFVERLELGTFLQTGHLIEGNELLVNFALLVDGVIIYPDMIQVIVSLDSGNIVAYDANKYLLSHMKRELPKPKITAEQARTKVNKNLKIEQTRLALIPLDNAEEVLTWEVKGKIDAETYYVYINVDTGQQEKILLIIETPEGSRSI